MPKGAHAIAAFAHGSRSSRLSPRNVAVASALNAQGPATLLFDLLTPDEEADRANVFDIRLFPEPGALEAVIGHAARWFEHYLNAMPPPTAKVQG